MIKIGYSASQEWQILLGWLFQHGEKSSPRGKNTKEILNYTSTVDMLMPSVLVKDRKLSYNFMAAEAHMILNGSNRVEDIVKYAPSIRQFSDGGDVFQGAYGPKVSEQMRYVIECLKYDKDSRQAIISIWREMPRQSSDIPCTLTMQFLIRKGRLNTVVNMRSSDSWLGWPYDVFTFSMISWYVCLALNEFSETTITPRTLHLNCGSQHLYEKNWEKARPLSKVEDSSSDAKYHEDIMGISFYSMNTPRDLMDALCNLKDKEFNLDD